MSKQLKVIIFCGLAFAAMGAGVIPAIVMTLLSKEPVTSIRQEELQEKAVTSEEKTPTLLERSFA